MTGPAREEVKGREWRLGGLLDSASDIIGVIDPRGGLRLAGAAEQALGCAPGELSSVDGLERVHPDDQTHVREALAVVLHDPRGALPALTMRVQHKDGSWRRLEAVEKKAAEALGRLDVQIVFRAVAGAPPVQEATGNSAAFRDRIAESRQSVLVFQDGKVLADTIIEILPGTFFILDGLGRAVQWNRAVEEATGLSPGDLRQRDALSTIHEEDRPRAAQAMRQVFELGHAETEARVVHRNGTARHFLLAGRRVDAGGSAFLVGVGVNITEGKRAEQAMRAARDYAENLIATASALVIELDVDGRIKVFNQAAEKITGYTSEELQGRNWFEVFVPRERYPQVWAEFERLTAGGFPDEFENPILTKSGEERYIVWRNSLVMEGGKPAGTVSLGVDITERKRAEERLTSLAQAVEQVADDIVITDTDGVIRYVNSSFEKTTGYSREEAVGQDATTLYGGDPNDAVHRDMWEHLRAGRLWKGRFTDRTKDGRVVLQDASVSAFRDGSGRILGFVSASRDVTRQVELETQAAEADKLEAIGTLAGGIAHDFNNILSAIVGYAQLALGACATESALRGNLEAILQASSRATELVRQILTFSRQDGREPRPIQPSLVVKEALKFLRASLPATIDIQKNIASESVVLADPIEIHRIVVNLCTNAALAMSDQGGVLRVSLEDVPLDGSLAERNPGAKTGPAVRVKVSDTGSGMTPEVMARIFEPFFTTREPGKGTGMGLAVVHGIVRKCQGAITVESRRGQGTTFEVYLPAAEPEAPAATPAAEELSRGTGRILVVDDEPPVRQVVVDMLRELGYTVDACADGAEALAGLEADPKAFDLVITDMTMPGMTGDALTAQIKRLRPGLPVILCTGYSEKISAETARTRGIDGFMMKPILLSDLAKIVRRVLDGR